MYHMGPQVSTPLTLSIIVNKYYNEDLLSTHTPILSTYRRFVRSQVIFANTMFRAVCYRQDECQIITGGTDRKIGYWETYDGSQIRELDGSKAESINGMDIHGKYFVTGGGDKVIKVS